MLAQIKRAWGVLQAECSAYRWYYMVLCWVKFQSLLVCKLKILDLYHKCTSRPRYLQKYNNFFRYIISHIPNSKHTPVPYFKYKHIQESNTYISKKQYILTWRSYWVALTIASWAWIKIKNTFFNIQLQCNKM